MSQISVLRDKVKDHLLGQIEKGELAIGKTINLAALSRTIGISVTPIREALSQLEQARVINAVPNRGFVVTHLTKTEARNLYETIAQLEVIALESSIFHLKDMESLRVQEKKLRDEKSLNKRFEFHRLLVKNCSNSILLQTLDSLKVRLRFYEQGFAKDTSFFDLANRQNEAILQAIQQDNIPTAALILKMNWMTVLDYVHQKMDENHGQSVENQNKLN
ncbi:GntR family transcriptional regulator [Muricauda sp. CAU 1633]|uniref:GntR family transcriptional regulator n=1 Tax=Allomuricauda sp. CAU 1633 TaxID=2816036 RepID=UPI001A8D9756|nr:GntR family transcriptional regulator [Muricauda sp. CAU 1633]MBO0323218.1 GntR family transcriptional regulator [Muricauda sp. CAU 1633]